MYKGIWWDHASSSTVRYTLHRTADAAERKVRRMVRAGYRDASAGRVESDRGVVVARIVNVEGRACAVEV